MPNRIIRESCRTSPTLAQLSHGAERMFWRLTTVADDFGRFEADPRVLLANTFPLAIGQLSVANMSRWFKELVDVGLVVPYSANGKSLGFFKSWGKYQQRMRTSKSKFPDPPIGQPSDSYVEKCEFPVEESRNRGIEKRDKELSDFDRFWGSYPNKTGKGAARRAWERLAPDAALAGRILVALEVQARSDKWLRDGGRYVPNPSTWLNQERWEDDAGTSGHEAMPWDRTL